MFAALLLLPDPGERLAMFLYAAIIIALLGVTFMDHLVPQLRSRTASATAEMGGFVLTDRRVFAMDAHLEGIAWTRPGEVTGGTQHSEPHRLRLWFDDGAPVDLDGVESPDTLLAAMDPGSGLRLPQPSRPRITWGYPRGTEAVLAPPGIFDRRSKIAKVPRTPVRGPRDARLGHLANAAQHSAHGRDAPFELDAGQPAGRTDLG